jgi:hypothetical protein
MAQLGQSYDQLSPEMYGTIPSNLHLTANRFVNNLFTCNDREGTNRAIVAGSCVWFGGATQRYQRDRTTDYFGSDTSTPSISAGVQFNLGKNWFLGLAIGNNTYETDFANPIGGSIIEGSSTQLGISLKKTMGATTIGVGLVGGFGDFSATRQTTFPFNATASSSQDTSLLGTKLRIAHDFGQPKSYIRPMLDFGLSKVKSQGFRETGAGALNLIVAEDRQVNTTISPALEVGGEFKSGKVLIRPRGSIGFTYNLTDPSPTLSAQFEGAPAGVSAFNVSSLADRSYLDLSADVNFVFPNGFSLMLGYLGQHSRNTSANAGQIKFSYSF